MIENIVNRALVSTYISQVTGNHPTSTGLSRAKHIFDPGPIQGERCIYLDKVVPCIKCFHSTLIHILEVVLSSITKKGRLKASRPLVGFW